MSKLQLDSFLIKSNLTKEVWEKSNTHFSELEEIAKEFEKLKPRLEQVATGIVGMLQKHSSVHSVRWRIKETDHLLAKIVRKRAEGIDKYTKLTKDNYFQVITDLVGVRVLHLFKADWSAIQDYLKENWEVTEGPTAFIRKGDDKTPFKEYGVIDSEIREHKDDYRSIHNIIQSSLVREPTNIEVQIRTIYEEAWSEIDHKVRYPNYSDNKELKFLLKILNGLSGNADEMGSFVNVLASQIKSVEKTEAQLLEYKASLESASKVKQEQLEQIRQLSLQNEEIQAALDKIKEADSAPKTAALDLNMSQEVLDSMSKAISLGSSQSTIDSIASLGSLVSSQSTIDSLASLGSSQSALDSMSKAISLGSGQSAIDSISTAVNVVKDDKE